MAGAFKSYDIRGIYGSDLTEEVAQKIGYQLGKLFEEFASDPGPKIVVGRDMRVSAPSITAALISGLRASGCQVLDIGMVTTPTNYFAIQRLQADGGVQVTASHNPPQYIGFKVSREQAIPISHATGLHRVEAQLHAPQELIPPGAYHQVDVIGPYLDFLLSMIPPLRPLRVVADASNGMAGLMLPLLFDRLPCQLDGLYLDPDGTFPNHEADPLKVENMRATQERVRATGADVGFCFDGDADRVAVVDEQGQIIGCDLTTALIAQSLLARFPGEKVTYDLRSSKAVPEAVHAAGGHPVRIRVGHSHAKQKMREINALCGGELSGHYYFRLHDMATSGTYFADSALVAMLQVLTILSTDPAGRPLSQILSPLQRYYHTGEINYSVADKEAVLQEIHRAFADAEVDELDGVTATYPDWWVNVRPSNTEPLLRLTLEGDTPALRDAGLARVEAILSRYGHRVSAAH